MFFYPNKLLDRNHSFIFFLLLIIFVPSVALSAPKDKSRWDNYYNTEEFIFGTKPFHFLKENIHLLPGNKALDLAMGEGRNGVFLATQGFDVFGLDISPLGLDLIMTCSIPSILIFLLTL